MKYLFPKIRLEYLLPMLGYACLGALIAGAYGMAHDQFTYAISPEYFTRFKFQQFRDADLGLPEGLFVEEIGFLASWWVGLIAAWLMARLVVPGLPRALWRRAMLRGIAIMITGATAGTVTGYILGAMRARSPDVGEWAGYRTILGVTDLHAFIQVAYIHDASYLGAVAGLLVAMAVLWVKVRRQGRREAERATEPG